MNYYERLKHFAFDLLENRESSRWYQKITRLTILALVTLNVFSVMIESVENVYTEYKYFLNAFEFFSIVIFSIEYCLRLWSSQYTFPEKGRFKARLKFMFSFYGLIDLLAILPFFLPMLIAFDLRFIRILRLLRLFRLMKIARYSRSMKSVGAVLKEKKEALILTLAITFLCIIISSSLMYYVEHEAQPKVFPDIFSTFYWAVATLTTVGYGDVYPITGWGKLLSGIIAVLGIGLVALPTGIIGSGFMEALESKKNKNANEKEKKFKYCPHCGEKL